MASTRKTKLKEALKSSDGESLVMLVSLSETSMEQMSFIPMSFRPSVSYALSDTHSFSSSRVDSRQALSRDRSAQSNLSRHCGGLVLRYFRMPVLREREALDFLPRGAGPCSIVEFPDQQ